MCESHGEFGDKTVEIIGDEMPAKDYAQIMSRVLKLKITYNDVPRERGASMSLPALRIGGHVGTCIPSRRAHTTRRRQILDEMQTSEAWLERNVPQFTGLFEAEPICSR